MENKKIKWETPQLVKLSTGKVTGEPDPDPVPDCEPGSNATICGNGGGPEFSTKS